VTTCGMSQTMWWLLRSSRIFATNLNGLTTSGQIDGPLSLTQLFSLPKPHTSILTGNQLLDRRLIRCLFPPTVHKTVTSRSTLATTKPCRVSSKAVVDFHSLKVLILNEWKSTAPFLWIRGNVRSACPLSRPRLVVA
jgi:hypothetical protein